MALYTARGVVQIPSVATAGGWTVFTASVDTNIIYVSNSLGNDGTGVIGDVTHPYKTIATAKALLRDGKPDWILFRQTDTWTLEEVGRVTTSGRSITELQVWGSYHESQPGVVDPATGFARPLFLITAASISGANNSFFDTFGGSGGDFVAIVGWETYAYERDPGNNPGNYNSGAAANSCACWGILRSTYMLIEDCKSSFFIGNSFQGSGTIIFNRNIITDSWQTDAGAGHSVGFFIANSAKMIFTENFWDHNGWNATVAGSPNAFSRNLYIEQTCGTDVTSSGDVSVQSGSEGIQWRTGGVMTNCLLAYNIVAGADLGHHFEAGGIPAINTANMSGCVFDTNSGRDLVPQQCQATGTGIHVNNCLFINSASFPLQFDPYVLPPDTSDNCDISSNTFRNNSSSLAIAAIDSGGNPVAPNGSAWNFGNTITPNNINLGAAWSRSLALYDSSVLGGPGTIADFCARWRLQSKGNWNPALTGTVICPWIRGGS